MERGAASAPDIDAVSVLVREVAHDIILPRFASLSPSDIRSKATTADPDDVVTVADSEAEARLTAGLLDLAPGSLVIGEEAAHADPSLLQRLHGQGPVWLVDPLDGTRNFVARRETFATMVAYCVDGVALAAWIHFPVGGDMLVAESGNGAWLNGVRVRVPAGEPGRRPRGVVHTRYMPRALADVALAQAARFAAPAEDTHSAAVEYVDVVRGGRDFAVYFRLLPWDHAGPALVVSEAGGVSVHASGARYAPRSPDQVTIVAADANTADTVRAWFAGWASKGERR